MLTHSLDPEGHCCCFLMQLLKAEVVREQADAAALSNQAVSIRVKLDKSSSALLSSQTATLCQELTNLANELDGHCSALGSKVDNVQQVEKAIVQLNHLLDRVEDVVSSTQDVDFKDIKGVEKAVERIEVHTTVIATACIPLTIQILFLQILFIHVCIKIIKSSTRMVTHNILLQQTTK